ncbi:MAG: hypothetical protein IK082_08050 [Oscillospiraceae bacterium]|nr:hypothetical protein [Oscillospiraceae bacterium]
MDSLKKTLDRRRIMISLRPFGPQDLGTGWEARSIIENPDIFEDLYSHFPLSGIYNLDDFFLYLLSLKLIRMREVIPLLLHEEHKVVISRLSENAKQAISGISNGDVIRFINESIQDIFSEDTTSYDIRSVTLDLIAMYLLGINKETLGFLCNNYGYLLIDRFEQFEKVFEQHPDLFESIFHTGHLDEVDSFRLEKVLDIWCHILNKGRSSLKETVASYVNVLAEDVEKLIETASIDNIMQVERTTRIFHRFLQRIKSPLANKFAGFAKKASDLLSEYILERGQSFKYEIPVEEMINRWKKTEDWVVRLMSITHGLKPDGDTLTYISRLSKEPEAKRSLIDIVSTNIPTDDYFKMSHQQMLSVIDSIETGTMVGIIRNQETLLDYLNLVATATTWISEQLNAEGEQLLSDIEMFSALVQLVANNLEIKDNVMRGICYGAAMYSCALAEKLLRILYMHLAKDERYIPVNNATIGDLLVVRNTHIVDVFGENHIRNLSFFLQRTVPTNVGQNIRNTLAHWADITPEVMTPFFVAKTLWLFTDILNTVFWYCLKDVTERNESDDQL